jgi:hypothetical protein
MDLNQLERLPVLFLADLFDSRQLFECETGEHNAAFVGQTLITRTIK